MGLFEAEACHNELPLYFCRPAPMLPWGVLSFAPPGYVNNRPARGLQTRPLRDPRNGPTGLSLSYALRLRLEAAL
jgi:hypothetical protein